MSGYLRTGLRRNARTSVTVLPSGKKVELASGTSLLHAVQQAGDAIVSECGGRALCGTCHVLVLEGARSLSKPSKDERDRLAQISGTKMFSRLSCQATLGVHQVTIQLVNH